MLGRSIQIFSIRFSALLASLIVLVLFARVLPQSEYGQYQNLWIKLLLIGGIANAGISIAVFSFSVAELRFFLSKITAKHIAIYGLFLLALSIWFISDGVAESSAADYFTRWLFFITYVLSGIMEAVLIVLKRFELLIVTAIIYFAGFLLFHYLYISIGFPLTLLIATIAALFLIRTMLFVYQLRKWLGATKKNELDNIGRGKERLWLHFALYNFYSVVFQWVDKYAVSLMVTAALSAAYFNGTISIPFLPHAFGAVSSALLLQLSSTKVLHNRDITVKSVHQASGLLSAIAFPIFAYLFFFRHEVFDVVFSGKYAEAVPIFAVSLLLVPVRCFDFVAILQSRGFGKIINGGALFDLLLACTLMYPFYLWLGLPGIALAPVVSTYAQSLYYLYCSGKILRYPIWKLFPVQKVIVSLGCFILLNIALSYGFKSFTPLTQIIAAGSINAAIAIGLLFRQQSGVKTLEIKKAD